jgi:leucyl-tRNA synthetase
MRYNFVVAEGQHVGVIHFRAGSLRKGLYLTIALVLSVMLGSVAGLRFSGPRLLAARRVKQSRTAIFSAVGAELSTSASTPSSYKHADVEKKWQKYWDENSSFTSTRRPGHPKKYVLDMFPYPSGSGLHVGHPEGYTATDIMARFWRMNDFDVLHPMGWDAFGLPAEQHAINTGTHPAVTTYENIATFKRQLKSLGFSYDWSRELSTTDDDYVRWTQWIFLKLFKANLANQSEVSVNWCPALGTVLANEEVIDGLSERGNHPVIRQPLRQWVLKITEYADKLEAGLSDMQWPEGTLSAQKQWIGRSVGASIKFKVHGSATGKEIEVFTTRADTLMGVSYLVLAPENPLIAELTTAENRDAVEKYVKEVASKSDMERTSTGKDRGKTGVALGAFAIHPISGEKVPILAADYVLAGYGTGAVMAVPAHDERDFEFAQLFNLPVKCVVKSNKQGDDTLPMVEPGVVCNSGSGLDGLETDAAKTAIIKKLVALEAGQEKVTYKLRDWVFSRQRYWGEPIPIYFPVEMLTPDGSGSPADSPTNHRIMYEKPIPVDEADLPLKLPDMTDFQPGDDPAGCLARATHWRYFQKDNKWFARETNTMPQVRLKSILSILLVPAISLTPPPPPTFYSGPEVAGTICALPTPQTSSS